jgi:PiT family inorganic phosphate transporter
VLGEIATGWITTPVIAGLITFIFLFFLQNVFNQKVYQNVNYLVSGEVIDMLEKDGIKREWTETYRGKEFNSEISFYQTLMKDFNDNDDLVLKIINKAKISPITVSEEILLTEIDREYLSTEQFYALEKLSGQQFQYKWQFDQALQKISPAWLYKATNIGNRTYNQNLKAQYEYLYRTFAAASQGF